MRNFSMSDNVLIRIAETTELSGLVLVGETQLLVGLSDSKWLRVPLCACPALQDLAGDDLLDYQLTVHRSRLRWPRHGTHLGIHDLAGMAIALEDGHQGPD
jgi:hypothetical protein